MLFTIGGKVLQRMSKCSTLAATLRCSDLENLIFPLSRFLVNRFFCGHWIGPSFFISIEFKFLGHFLWSRIPQKVFRKQIWSAAVWILNGGFSGSTNVVSGHIVPFAPNLPLFTMVGNLWCDLRIWSPSPLFMPIWWLRTKPHTSL